MKPEQSRAGQAFSVTIHEAKTNLSKLIAAVEAGGEVVISRGATPVVRIVPLSPPKKRIFGAMKGRVSLDDTFFEPLPEDELTLWEAPSRYAQLCLVHRRIAAPLEPGA
jgi:prevent-host-death family protein